VFNLPSQSSDLVQPTIRRSLQSFDLGLRFLESAVVQVRLSTEGHQFVTLAQSFVLGAEFVILGAQRDHFDVQPPGRLNTVELVSHSGTYV